MEIISSNGRTVIELWMDICLYKEIIYVVTIGSVAVTTGR